ncbi:GerAB/ArcD/ProY family transporter [Salinibacillus xinjiangensis]|uniref:GerAB/ArcD/ProY family transporter n=1 Tax=Salinibacillus xinjiangensis TaxID=1229268 RepID=A0A6G1X9R1_9BACI|nr:GerAB/ArcD/ProY family transporter [Salinibacillus xinjiangensis]MRG87610.1 GerAB/ArcD/ProY family transporter [Salinibacillus xinjiangensis]
MKQFISPFQLAILVANFIFAAALITLPQILTQISIQNTWIVPFLVYPIVVVLLLIGFGRGNILQSSFLTNHRSSLHHLFYITIGLFLVIVYIRDLRAFIDFTSRALLPTTPIEVIAILVSVVLLYISSTGIEVVTRITVIQFIMLSATILSLPFMLLNEIELSHIMPILGTDTVENLSKSSFELLPWMGESLIFFFLLGNVAAKKGVKRAIIIGVSIGFFLLFLLIITSIAVLGENIVSKSIYPNFIMIQQINITDFLDRLDLIIVILWMPVLLSKLALTLYCIHRAFFNPNGGTTSNLLMTPLSLLLAVLAIILFENNTVHLEFTFLTWTIIGIVMEFLLLILVLILRFRAKATSLR